MISIALSTVSSPDGEYARAIRLAGAEPRLLEFDPRAVDDQLDGTAGVIVSGGGADVDPRLYGGSRELARGSDARRDAFELALVRRARERGLPTLCICRGVQLANVAFGGSLFGDIGVCFDAPTAALHRVEVDGETQRGLIAGHDVAIRPGSLLATIAGNSTIVTSSRHHQSIANVADDLEVVGSTPDGIVEAVEARFPSPFWLGVQWHPESTLALGDAPSRAIFEAFVSAAEVFGAVRHAGLGSDNA